MVLVDGQPRVAVQFAPNHVALAGPDGELPQQIHLDLWVDDMEDARRTGTSLGARMLKAAEEGGSADAFGVYADPAGHPFCLCWIKASNNPAGVAAVGHRIGFARTAASRDTVPR